MPTSNRLDAAGHWTDYPIGVARELSAAGFAIPPVNLLIRSTVPEGSGLSSSAALEVSTALAFLGGRHIAPLELALLCQRAENDFVGMPCGIMDQYISVFGRRNSAVEIDCRSLEHRDVPLPASATFVAVNSMVKHALAASAYKERVEECALALTCIARLDPAVRSLRDVSPDQFDADLERQLPPKAGRRARHVIHENARVAQFCEAATRGDLDGMGRLMVESHRSLQYDYEVSCAELDFLVDRALQIEGVIGSRMTGGGFGGCTVTMLRPESVDQFRREISHAYEERFHVTARIYECRPSDGAAGECRNAEALPPTRSPAARSGAIPKPLADARGSDPSRDRRERSPQQHAGPFHAEQCSAVVGDEQIFNAQTGEVTHGQIAGRSAALQKRAHLHRALPFAGGMLQLSQLLAFCAS